MSLRDVRRHAGQLAIAGFAGGSIPADLRALAREFDLGGIIGAVIGTMIVLAIYRMVAGRGDKDRTRTAH